MPTLSLSLAHRRAVTDEVIHKCKHVSIQTVTLPESWINEIYGQCKPLSEEPCTNSQTVPAPV